MYIILIALVILVLIVATLLIKKKTKSSSYPSYTASYGNESDDTGKYIQHRLETCEKCCHTYEPLPECKDIHQYRFVTCGEGSEQCNREQECLMKCVETRGRTKADLEFCRHIECG